MDDDLLDLDNGKQELKNEVDNKNSFIKKDSLEWLDDEGEVILIFGLPKHGKTFAYCSIIEEFLEKNGKIYIMSTEAGFIRTAKAYFGDDIKEKFKDKVKFRLVFDISSIRNFFKEIQPILKKNDLLVIDLVSDVWEWAQIDFVDKLSKGEYENFIYNAMKDISSFGMFDSNKWNYIKALHKFVEDIIVRKVCSFIGVCTEKDTNVEIKKGGKDTIKQLSNLGFDEMSVRPGGMKLLPYKYETVLRINKNEKGYYFQVIGDRGYKTDLIPYNYDKSMYKKLKDWRLKN